MRFTVVNTFKANVREIPGNLPPRLWWEKVQEYRDDPATMSLPWYNPMMELLAPEDLATVRAKARVWWEITGSLPEGISIWREIRMARHRGDIPLTNEVASGEVDDGGTLHCGKCAARWSPAHDGSPHGDRCGLCGVRLDIGQGVAA